MKPIAKTKAVLKNTTIVRKQQQEERNKRKQRQVRWVCAWSCTGRACGFSICSVHSSKTSGKSTHPEPTFRTTQQRLKNMLTRYQNIYRTSTGDKNNNQNMTPWYIQEKTITGNPSNQDLRYTQKPLYLSSLTNNICSYLLLVPRNSMPKN